MQIGGRLLGQGVYGCTFDPVPRCANGTVFKRVGELPAVGKITSEDAADELAIGSAIMALPLADQYFAVPTISCEPALPLEDPDRGACRVTEEAEAGTRFSMLVMPAAGRQLIKWAENKERLADSYLGVFAHLLEGLVILHRGGIVHNDIHMGNALVDERGVARFIDVGLSFKLSQVAHWSDANLSTRFRPNYMWQAPEVHAWRMKLNGVPVATGAAALLDQNEEWRQIERQFAARPALKEALSSFLTAEGAKTGGQIVRAYGPAFDCWRIGLMFWILWTDLLTWSGFQQTALWARRDLVRQVLGGLTDFDPRTRWSERRALAALDPQSRFAAVAAK